MVAQAHETLQVLQCPQCTMVLGSFTATWLVVGAAVVDGPVKLRCSRCGRKLSWRPERTKVELLTGSPDSTDP